MKKKLAVIGAGIGGLAAAALLARKGFSVEIFEKNDQSGGRARYWTSGAYRFDMGPSWYLMPEVFERWFKLLDRRIEDYCKIKKLPVSYRTFFEGGKTLDITANYQKTLEVFKSFEPEGDQKLGAYLKDARTKYTIALGEFLYKDYKKLRQFFNRRFLLQGTRMGILSSLDRMVRRRFSSLEARQILEYTMIFLGTSPKDAPSMYSLMSHVDLEQGVWYPAGGMAALAQAIRRVAEEEGVIIHEASPVEKLAVEKGRIKGLYVHGKLVEADCVLANADYHHVEQELLEEPFRDHSARWWQKRKVAPSMLLLYLGVKKKLPELDHHNLYFSQNWDDHFDALFKTPKLPQNPCFYVSMISKTDADAAPDYGENLFVLVPLAPGLNLSPEEQKNYAAYVIDHLEKRCGISFKDAIEVQRIFGPDDFAADYNAFKGTALGLSHTLGQTAFFRPQMRSRRVKNLFYSGQYTHPGIGVPMVLIAAEIVSHILEEEL